MLIVIGARSCVWDTGQLVSKATHVLPRSAASFTPNTAPGIFSRSSRQEVVPSGFRLPVPGLPYCTSSRTGRDRGKKALPQLERSKCLGRGGEAADGGPALSGDHHSNRKGAARSWRRRSGLALSLKRGPGKVRACCPACFMSALGGSDCHTLSLERGA